MRLSAHRGFTLIELLVVIAIIAILAAILFPVFAKAREKARQTACTNNQRQIVVATQMYAQDHEEIFPEVTEFWGVIALERGTLKCPSKARIANGYAYNNKWAGMSLGEIEPPEQAVIIADGMHAGKAADANYFASYDNIFYAATDLDKRHGKKLICAFADGHVQLMADVDANQLLDNLSRWGVIQPVGATANSEFDSGLKLYAINAVNGNGLPVGNKVPTGGMPATWPAHVKVYDDATWMSNGTPGVITFDLGANYGSITGFHLWNYNDFDVTRSIKTCTITSDADGFTADHPLTVATLTQATYSDTYAGEDYTFATPITNATKIKITILTSYGATAPGYAGIAEIRFIYAK